MRIPIVFRIVAAAALLLGTRSYAAETNSPAPAPAIMVTTNSSPSHEEAEKSLTLLLARARAKLQMGKQNEADFADIFKDFDSLLAKYPKLDDDRMNILFQEGQLYLADLGDPIKALPIFEQLKKEFPELVINDNTDIFLAGLREGAEAKKIQDALAPGTPFPDFNETDLQGKPLSIARFKGKVVLLDFWGTWCPLCLIELPDIQKAYKKYHDKGFEVVGISMDEDKDVLEKFIKQKKVPWPQYFQGARFDGKLAIKYGIEAAPTTYLLDRDGKIIKLLHGTDDLDKDIEDALKKS